MGFVGCFVHEALNKHVYMAALHVQANSRWFSISRAYEASSCLSDVSPSGWARAFSPIARSPTATGRSIYKINIMSSHDH